MMETVFERLIRFQDPTGEILFGEAPSSVDGDDFVGQKALVYAGEQPWLLKPTGEQREISKVCLNPFLYRVVFR